MSFYRSFLLFCFFFTTQNHHLVLSTLDCIKPLIDWITENDGFVSTKIDIKLSTHGYGVFSIPTAKHEEILSIPLPLLFTTDSANNLLRNIFPIQSFKSQIQPLPNIEKLALALLIEYHNPRSFWRPFWNCLPSYSKYQNDSPLYWTDNTMKEHLQFSPMIEYLQRRNRSIKQSFDEISEIFEHTSITKYMLNGNIIDWNLENWKWSLITLWSRSFSVIINHEKQKSLVPYGDFFNFNSNLNNVSSVENVPKFIRYDIESFTSGNNFVFRANEEITEHGKEIFVEYNAEVLPNIVLLMDYSFCISDNPIDGLWISFSDLVSRPHLLSKIQKSSQTLIKQLLEALNLQQIFLMRYKTVRIQGSFNNDLLLSEKNMKDANAIALHIKPEIYSLYILSLIVQSYDDIQLYGQLLLGFEHTDENLNGNQEILLHVLQLIFDSFAFDINGKYVGKEKQMEMFENLVKKAWKGLNLFVKKFMRGYETTLMQDWMIFDAKYDGQYPIISDSLDCGLVIRMTDKRILMDTWIQLKYLNRLLKLIMKNIT